MKTASKIFKVFTIIFVLVLIFWFTQLNYRDLSFQENSNIYFGISAVILIIFALQMIKKSIEKNNERK